MNCVFKLLLVLTAICLLQSCNTSRLYYFNDLKPSTQIVPDSILQQVERRIHTGDRVSVVVSSADPSQTSYLNPPLQVEGNQQQSIGYLVSKTGNITLPLLGEIQVKGFTSDSLTKVLIEKYKLYFHDPYVFVNLSGRVFVLNKKGGSVVPIINERITIFETLAQAGGTDYGDRLKDVWLVREQDGFRTFVQLNLNSKKIFESPYYYLQPNDLVYVQLHKLSYLLSTNNPVRNLVFTSVAMVSLFYTIFTRL